MTRRGWIRVGLMATAGGLLASCAGVDAATPIRPTVALALQSSFVQVVRHTVPSVVQITTPSGLGSGVIYDTAGDIVTNDHVVAGATGFTVQLPGSSAPAKATLVGTYAPDDLAVIQVQGARNLTPARFGDSANLEVGDWVLAIGNPLGLSSSVTDGIVSAVGRAVTEPAAPGSPQATLPDVIQTSAAINPGNSGGALVDLAGDVVGISTLAAVDQEIGGAAPGIGFAIPSNMAKDVANQIIANGRVVHSRRAGLDIAVYTVVASNGTPVGAGVAAVVAGGAADKGGIVPGDIIVSVDGVPTPTAEALAAVLAQLQPGDRASVEVITPSGARRTVNVVLGQLPNS